MRSWGIRLSWLLFVFVVDTVTSFYFSSFSQRCYNFRESAHPVVAASSDPTTIFSQDEKETSFRRHFMSGENLLRRDLLRQSSSILLGAFALQFLPTNTIPAAFAVGEGEQRMVLRQKPTAPLGALLPAIQQRLLLEAALGALVSGTVDDSVIEKLKSILSPLDDQSSKRGQNQDVRLLKLYNPATTLRGDLVRAAMNLYTTNLNYSALYNSNSNDAYDVTDPNWKKSYIRANDGLPDIQKVIGADLDLRYLYRNQVELKIQDAAAELYYAGKDLDDKEIKSLLQEAAQYFDLWLDRVRYGDVRDALDAALSGQTTQVYDTWAAGFLPPAATISTTSGSPSATSTTTTVKMGRGSTIY